MPSLKVAELTKVDIAQAAEHFEWTRQLPKWTVLVNGRELPVRPLILSAAGVLPNDPTNSHQAVQILQEQGFEVRYQGKPLENSRPQPADSLEDLIDNLRGCCAGGKSMVELRKRENKKDEKY